MSLNKLWEWIVGALLAPLGMMFYNAGEYISIIILLVLADFFIGLIVKVFVLKGEWSWNKFLLSVPVKIVIAFILFPVLLNAQTKFDFMFDATKYVAMTFSFALMASMFDNAGQAYGVNVKDKIIERFESLLPK